jgi:hypothetical protein
MPLKPFADRDAVADLIEQLLDAAHTLIQHLDLRDPDPDLEPTLAGPPARCRCVDRQCEHDGREPEDFL